ncbi:MAG: serine/threonine-protein kinase [Ilumatobacter sp.]
MSLRVDGFTDVSPLAGGGFGSVYKATRASTGGVVALKVLDRAPGDDDDLLERRLRREIAALVALKGHPNVVQVEQVVSTANGPAIVMEFMGRGSVLDSDDAGNISPTRVGFIGAATASGLAAGHDVGIVHRDVKPQNVLVNNFGQVKLCDFGIAAIQRSAEFQTRTTALSVRYASPEELDNDINIGAPTDVYSLGASLFHLMFGEPPSFRGGRGADPNLTRNGRGRDAIADQVASIIEQCLSEEPAHRPTASECARLLSALSGGVVPEPTPKGSPLAQRRRRARESSGDDITAERPDRSDESPSQPPPPNAAERGPDRRPASNQPSSNQPPPPLPGQVSAPRLPATSNERWWT